jgi:hypothetical protein
MTDQSDPQTHDDAVSGDGSPGLGPVQDIVARLEGTSQGERVTLGDAIEAFGRRSFLPLLMVPALLVVSPLSGIPFFSSLCGLTIALIAGQMLWPGQDYLWLPDRFTRQNVSGERARNALARLGRFARWLDTHAKERFSVLVGHRPGRKAIELCCLLAGLSMPVLEIVPFSSSILGVSVLFMATGLLTRDGLFALLGLCVLAATPLLPLHVVDNVLGGSGAG